MASEEQQGRVVIQVLAGFAAELGDGFAKGGERLARYVEAEHVPLELRLRRRIRQRAWPTAGDELFDLA